LPASQAKRNPAEDKPVATHAAEVHPLQRKRDLAFKLHRPDSRLFHRNDTRLVPAQETHYIDNARRDRRSSTPVASKDC
jgi:hypothetical protein